MTDEFTEVAVPKVGKYGVPSVDQILAIRDTKTAPVDVDEWKMTVVVQGLTKAQELAYRKQSNGDDQKFEGLMLIGGIVEPKFEKHHLKDLQAKSSGAVNKILMEILRLSGLAPDAQKEIEEDFQE